MVSKRNRMIIIRNFRPSIFTSIILLTITIITAYGWKEGISACANRSSSPGCCRGDIYLTGPLVPDLAFANCLITSVRVDSNVKWIGAGAFKNCPKLKLIMFNYSASILLEYISSDAFGGTTCATENNFVYLPNDDHKNKFFSCTVIVRRGNCFDIS